MYYVLYEHPECGPTWELISGEDATFVRVTELMTAFDIEASDIKVFNADDELDAKEEPWCVYAYAVTETNVDGRGGNVTEHVAFPNPLSEDGLAELRQYLADSRERDGGLSIHEHIGEALRRLEEAEIAVGLFTPSPVSGEIEF